MSLLFDLALLMLWLRLLPQRSAKVFHNPYVAAVIGWVDRGVGFLRMALPILSPYAAAALAFVFLLAFRGIATVGLKLDVLELVGVWTFKARLTTPSLGIAFSLISFGLLLHRLWTMDWLLSLLRPHGRNRAGQAFSALCSPLSHFSFIPRGVFLLAFGGVLATLLFSIGIPAPLINAQTLPAMPDNGALQGAAHSLQSISAHVAEMQEVTFGLFWVLGAMAMVDALTFAVNALILCFLLAIVGALFKSPVLGALGAEGSQHIIEGVFRKPVRWGAFNVAPILFLLLFSFSRGILMTGLMYVLRLCA